MVQYSHYSKIVTFQVQRTPLHFAAVGGVIEIAKLLLEKGADPNNKNEVSVKCIGA